MHRACRIFLLAVAMITVAAPMGSLSAQGKVADLQQQLESGLKARLPHDFAFIKRVVTLVDNNKLPLKLVKGTFQWARKKGKYKNYPFPHFERALRERAKKIGVAI